MRLFINAIALVGLAVFGSAFIASYASPILVESLARDAIRLEVERRVGERIDALEGSGLMELAKRLSGQNASEIADLKRKLAEGLPEKVASVAAQMRDLNCACRRAIERSLTGILEGRAANLSHIHERLELLIRTKYMSVAESLTREFRIFTGANAQVFMLLVLVSGFRKRAGLQLILPTFVLLGAVGLTGSLYLFHQNWWQTIIFSEYVGFWYFGYLTLAIALLVDILLNRARLTTQVLNAAFGAVGATLQAVPC